MPIHGDVKSEEENSSPMSCHIWLQGGPTLRNWGLYTLLYEGNINCEIGEHIYDFGDDTRFRKIGNGYTRHCGVAHGSEHKLPPAIISEIGKQTCFNN